jgi:hypothetical protein
MQFAKELKEAIPLLKTNANANCKCKWQMQMQMQMQIANQRFNNSWPFGAVWTKLLPFGTSFGVS